MAGFNPYAAKGVPTPKPGLLNALGSLVGAGTSNPLYRRGAVGGTIQDDPLTYLFRGRSAAAQPTPRTQLTQSGDAQLGNDPGSQFSVDRRKPDTTDRSRTNLGGTPIPPGRGPTPIIQASDEEYNRLLSQYGGPAGVEQLAMQTTLPTGFTPAGAKGPASLKDFYSAERQVGGRDLESIIPSLTQGLDPTKAQKIKEWAKANPMLAQREYARSIGAKQEAAGYSGTGPSDEAIRAAMASGKFFPAAGSPAPITGAPGLAGQTSFSGAANAVPAPPQQQGAAVSAPYAAANAQAAEKTAGATGMPAFETTAQPQTTLDKVNTFVKTLFPAGVGQIFGPRY